jgi:hypothetical protein
MALTVFSTRRPVLESALEQVIRSLFGAFPTIGKGGRQADPRGRQVDKFAL